MNKKIETGKINSESFTNLRERKKTKSETEIEPAPKSEKTKTI